MFEAKVHDPMPKHQIDSEIAILRCRSQPDAAARNGAHQVALGEMGTLVGQLAFGTDQRDLAVKPPITEPSPHRIAGRSGADDYGLRSSSRTRRSDHKR